MEKIVLLSNALNFKPATLDTAAYIARMARSKLTGLFVDGQPLVATPELRTLGGNPYVEEIVPDEAELQQRREQIARNVAAFTEGCVTREAVAITKQYAGAPMEAAVKESRFADLLVADACLSFPADDKAPSKFVLELLGHAECPVLISAENFEPIEEVVLAYDGSRSSVFAIKQLVYLLPKFADKRLVVLHISKEGHERTGDNFKEWLDMHFANVTFLELTGDARELLFEYFMTHNEKCNKMLVTGAFGRSFLSMFFQPSTAELVLKSADIPIFITHH